MDTLRFDIIIHLTRNLTNPILALLLEKTMFDVDLMEQFYDHEPENKDFDVDESVKRAYYVFIKRIATAISPKFQRYLRQDLGEKDNAVFAPHLTTSDEGFAYWIVQCKIDECKKDVKEINDLDGDLNRWSELKGNKKGRKKGPTDSKVHYDRYAQICHKIRNLRKENKKGFDFWMKIFYDQLYEEADKFDINAAPPDSPRGK